MENTANSLTKRIIPVLPISTRRATVAASLLENLIVEEPKYRTTVNAVISYPIMKWALEHQEKSGLTETDSSGLIVSAYTDMTGMGIDVPSGAIYSGDRSGMFGCYREIVDLIDAGVAWLETGGRVGRNAARAIRYINFAEGDKEEEELSNFQMKSYYVDGIKFLWGHINDRLVKIVDRMNALAENPGVFFAGPVNPMFSNIYYLFDLYGLMDDPRLANSTACIEIKELLKLGVGALDDSPMDAEMLQTVMREIMNGNNSKAGLTEACNMVPNTVRRYKYEAYHLIAVLLFGYTTDEIMDFLYAVQHIPSKTKPRSKSEAE